MNELLAIVDEEVIENEGFTVDTDLTADWCLDKIREEEAEIQRMKMVVEQKIYQMQQKLESFKAQKEQTIQFFTYKLNDYMETLDIKETKAGNKVYNLPSGKLSLKKQGPEVLKNEKELLEFVKENHKKFIKTKESVDWANFKKELTQSGNKFITADGEVVECINLLERAPKFEVKL